MRFLTLLAVLLLTACNNSEPSCESCYPAHFPEIY